LWIAARARRLSTPIIRISSWMRRGHSAPL
jgi:hypothetical protein